MRHSGTAKSLLRSLDPTISKSRSACSVQDTAPGRSLRAPTGMSLHGQGVRLAVGAGQDQMLVACAQHVASGWAVRTPLTEPLVKVATWPSAYGWMLEELHGLLPGRLVGVGQVHRRAIQVTSR
jgi:hypothetical protein